MEFSHQIRVTYQETDRMGVVYYANYLHWFEIGRTELLRQLGISYKELEERGVVLPVVESHCNYHAPARYDDLVDIYTEVEELKRTKITFNYKIVRAEDEQLLTTGSTVHPFVNHDFKPLSLKKAQPELWSLLQKN
ncbi:acyl-CoA thioesterase [Natroniella sulfidigena]|uniref:acyl-CoA thioesterase n=1 Tax=Natroniella sulfidigena TaxID=723921 RepID=UPI00200A8BD9|nr:thioesterase family protein [Natroniella sulfidigena]MCK8815792.1 acyl-CoA thioesterase [Natroniella sulfidigena]